MKSYKYLSVSSLWEIGKLDLVSTDSQVLDWFLAELQKVFPTCSVRDEYGKFPSGEKCSCCIDWPKGESWVAGLAHLWVVKQLCLQGWEPFAVHHSGGDNIHDLRLEVANNRGSDSQRL